MLNPVKHFCTMVSTTIYNSPFGRGSKEIEMQTHIRTK